MTTASNERQSHRSDLTKNIRDSRDRILVDAFEDPDPVLIDALPSAGKSYGVVKWAAETENPVTVFTSRHELFEQYQDWGDEYDLSVAVLPSIFRECPTASGEFGDEWVRRIESVYKLGVYPGELHTRDRELFGERLPCQEKGKCRHIRTRRIDPEDFDILVGHYRHAHVPERFEDRYVVLDEFPEDSFLTEFSSGQVNRAVSTYLNQYNEIPYRYANSLRQARYNEEKSQEILSWFEQHNPEVSRSLDSAVDDASRKTHVQAPALVYALLTQEQLENEWEYAEIPGGRVAVQDPVDGAVTLLTRPDFSDAASVVALDGTPVPEMWEILLGPDLKHAHILPPEKKGVYLRDEMGFTIIQTTELIKPYSKSSGEMVTVQEDLAVIDAIGRREGKLPTLISTKAAIKKYQEHDEFEDLVVDTAHYGDFKGSNEFKFVRLGLVIGSQHLGDPYVQKWAALAGESAERVDGTQGKTLSYGNDVGDAVLRFKRENEVLQAVLRFGREKRFNQEKGGATVYVHTSALPEWVLREKRPAKISRGTEKRKELLDTIYGFVNNGTKEWRTSELADQVELGERQVRNNLRDLEAAGFLDRRTEQGNHIWRWQGPDKVPTYGFATFED